MLIFHARNGDEIRTPQHRGSPANVNVLPFVNLVNQKFIRNSWNLAFYNGEASTCCGKNFVPFGAGLGICFAQTRASTIYVASYCFQKNSSVNIEQQKCCVLLCDFSGFVWTFYALTEFSMHFMCIIQIWTTCTCSIAYKLVEKSQKFYVSFGTCLGPMQEMGMNFKDRGNVDCRQNIEMPRF